MDGFGVALNYKDLKHLVLSDKRAVDTVQNVAEYLRMNGTSNGIFSLKDEEPSFKMAERYSRLYLNDRWQKEKKNATIRVEKHWEEVQRKQKLAQKLRMEIATLKKKEAKVAEILLMPISSGWSTKLKRQVQTLRRDIYNAQQKLKEAEKAPKHVIQPLPSDESKARFSFTAQQLILPRPWVSKCGGTDGDQYVNVFDHVSR
eukprot:2818950-Ditylum_brightwellii.AAC.1